MLHSAAEARRTAIRELLSERPVRNQHELQSALEKRGHVASQPVLSRDLRALRVAKREGVYQIVDDDQVTPLSTIRGFLRGVSVATHFTVVHCEPGAANAVARALEAEPLDGIAGTVAGDDTVLVALNSQAAARRVRQRITELQTG